MELRRSERKKAKIKLALQGCAGSGKTYSSILLAKGLTTNGDLSKVVIIDTEAGSADLYAHLGNYNVISLKPPFTPTNYIEAIDMCLEAGMEIIIIDGISNCWEYLLEYHASLPGNSFTNWNKTTLMQKAFINKILQSDAHFIATMRVKQDYVLNNKNGKFVPEKVGLKAVQRDSIGYEFTIVFDIDIKHQAKISKNRTGLFSETEFMITPGVGRMINDWCNEGVGAIEDKIKTEIDACTTIEALRFIYSKYPNHQVKIKDAILERKAELEHVANQMISNKEIIKNLKNHENGNDQK